MSYHKYTTEAIVLKRKTLGEANVSLYVLTEELGLIVANAQSARTESSKLKSSLQEYSLLTITCIKSKNGWKITNVLDSENLYFNLDLKARVVLAKISSLLLQMITGESVDKKVFTIVRDGFEYLYKVNEDDLHIFEIILVLKILYELGYVAKENEVKAIIENTKWSDSVISQARENKNELVKVINSAIKASHL